MKKISVNQRIVILTLLVLLVIIGLLLLITYNSRETYREDLRTANLQKSQFREALRYELDKQGSPFTPEQRILLPIFRHFRDSILIIKEKTEAKAYKVKQQASNKAYEIKEAESHKNFKVYWEEKKKALFILREHNQKQFVEYAVASFLSDEISDFDSWQKLQDLEKNATGSLNIYLSLEKGASELRAIRDETAELAYELKLKEFESNYRLALEASEEKYQNSLLQKADELGLPKEVIDL